MIDAAASMTCYEALGTAEGGTSQPRVWLVTGSSRGLGAHVVSAALAAGDVVVATGRTTAALLEKYAGNDNVLVQALDITDVQQVNEAVAAARAKFGRIDVLVNNAGYGHVGIFEETSLAEYRAQ